MSFSRFLVLAQKARAFSLSITFNPNFLFSIDPILARGSTALFTVLKEIPSLSAISFCVFAPLKISRKTNSDFSMQYNNYLKIFINISINIENGFYRRQSHLY